MEPPETYAGADGTTEEEGGETRQGKHWMVQTCELSTSFNRFIFKKSFPHCKVAEKNEDMRTLQERIRSLEAKAGQNC